MTTNKPHGSWLLDNYRSHLRAAYPAGKQWRAANREARLLVYKALIKRWGHAAVGRHVPAIAAALNRVYDEETGGNG